MILSGAIHGGSDCVLASVLVLISPLQHAEDRFQTKLIGGLG